MTSQWTAPMVAHAAVEGTVREQLRAAWERGLDTAPHGVNAQADRGAPAAFDAIMTTVDSYVAAVITYRLDQEQTAGKQAGG